MDLQSILGYSKGSPYANNPFLDINTPEGLIDMSKTPIDLIGIDNKGNKKVMKAGSKNPYKFEGDIVREIPMQKGGMSPASIYKFLFDDEEDTKKEAPEPTAPTAEDVAPEPEQTDDEAMKIALGDGEESIPTSGNPYNAEGYGASMATQGNPYIPTTTYKAGERGKQIIGDITSALGYTPQFNSVFRTPEKQAELIKQGWGVKNSFHLTGDAIDMKPADWKKMSSEKQAEIKSKYDVIYHNNHYHVEPKGSPVSSSPIAVPKDKAKYAYDFFQKKGLESHHAAGIVGNLIQESGNFRDDVIAGTKKGDSGLATGIAQWHGARKDALEEFARSKGMNPYSLDAQLEFVYYEANKRGDLQALKTSANPEDAAYIFAKRYERPRIVDPYRINYAKNIYNGSSR